MWEEDNARIIEMSPLYQEELIYLELGARKLKAMREDTAEKGLRERRVGARQIANAIWLHARMFDFIATDQRLEPGGIDRFAIPLRLTISSDHIVHTVEVTICSDCVRIESMNFTKSNEAPADFELYPFLEDISRIIFCPYKIAA